MALFPFFQNIKNKRILVIGGGRVAAEKVQKLRTFTDNITVIAPETGIQDVTLIKRRFKPEDLDQADLVIAATDDSALNRQAALLCMDRNIPVNVADTPSLCTFLFPSLISRGSLTVGITTEGKSPSYCRSLREEIESILPEHIGDILDRMGTLRTGISADVQAPGLRKRIYHAVLRELILSGNEISDKAVDQVIRALITDKSYPACGGGCGQAVLVGAGCGPGLITERGLNELRHADVVVYDSLIDDALLDEAPPYAEKLCVGKRFASHSAEQEEINAILVQKSKEGKKVVRLKGGDSFVFGRGGEECQALQEAGIPFSVIPGISSAIAVPEHAGIPVTHRGTARSFTVVTGTTADGTGEDYRALAALNGTLIFLMGVHALREITHELIACGKDPDTPAAIISRGYMADESRISGTLKTIAGQASDVKTPAVLVIGDTAALDLTGRAGGNAAGRYTDSPAVRHEEMRSPLTGARIVITGTPSFARRVQRKAAESGGLTFVRPTLDIEPHAERIPLEFSKYKWIVFTSSNGVDLFFRTLRQRRQDIRSMSGILFACIGQRTEQQLSKYGIYADLVPSEYSSEALGYALAQRWREEKADGRSQNSSDVLLLRAENASSALPEILLAAGIPAEDRKIYRTVFINNEMQFPECDYMVFGSAAGVQAYFYMKEKGDQSDGGFRAVCIGHHTASQWYAHSSRPCLIADSASADGIVREITKDWRKRNLP